MGMQQGLVLVDKLVDQLLPLQSLSQEHVLRLLFKCEWLVVSFLAIDTIESDFPIQFQAQDTQLSSLCKGI